jgi:AraC-like DNA-binding protein
LGEPAVRSQLFDTAHFRPADRFDWWAAAMEENIGIATAQPESGTFEGRLGVLSFSSLTYLDFKARNVIASRQALQIRRLEWGQYFIYREMGTGGYFEIGGRRFVTRPGDLLIYDGDGPFRAEAKLAYRHEIWVLPKATLDPHLPPLPRPLAIHVPASAGIADLAVAYIDALSGVLSSLDEVQAALIADHLGRLIAITCGCAADGHRTAIEEAKLAQAQRYVSDHLTHPGLGPDATAAALGISVRRLQLVFQQTGETFSHYVRRRRLQEIRATLENPLFADRSITDIALGWGFASLPTFYRAFATEYGAAPGDIRQARLGR